MGKNNFIIKKLFPDEWKILSENAHLIMFNEQRPKELDRIDYALISEDQDKKICGYLTARELDAESVYWQFGGAFPGTHSSAKAVQCYQEFVAWALQRYQRITTLVENTNVRYLRLAMHFGFRIIGCRLFHGKILVELLNEKQEGDS